MAITGKQYLDLEGLSKFKELLVSKYADGTFTVMKATNATNAEIATNYKTADGSASIADALASKADSATLTEEVGNLVPKTTTIAGVDLNDNITASELISALDASRKIVNVIETVKVRNNGETGFSPLQVTTDKAVEIDLSGYAKTSDISSVLQFKGTVDYVKDLPETETVKEGDVWHVRYSGSEGTSGLNAEYVYINGGWELLGPVVDLSAYYTKTEADAKISTAVSTAKTEIENAYKGADTALQGTLQGNIDALYKVDGESVTGTIATRISAVETKANANETAINTLKGGEAVEGSVAKAIKDKIDALDSTSSVASDSDAKGGYVYSINQTDGKVAVKTANFSGSVASGDANAVTGGAVATYVTGEIAKLDVTDIGSAGKYISVVGEIDGNINATATDFVSSVKADTTEVDNVAPNEHAVRTAIDSDYNMITAVPLEGAFSIESIFAKLISKTRELISGTLEVAENDIVTSIGNAAFYQYNTLTSISFPSVKSIGNDAFFQCTALTSISLPATTSIGQYAFYGCTALTSVTGVSFPKAVYIENDAFKDCTALTSVELPVATSIEQEVFAGCNTLTSVSLPEATSIGYYAFQYCSALTSVELPVAIRIKDFAFKGCTALTNVELPVVTRIGKNAFEGCTVLTTMYIGTEETSVCSLSDTNAIPSSVTDIYVPKALVDSYKTATNWSSFADKIKAYTGV